MATIADAVRQGVLRPFRLPPHDFREPVRELFVARAFDESLDDDFFDTSRRIGRRTLAEHLDVAFSDFRCLPRPSSIALHTLMPGKHGVWKMHPTGLRVYGWLTPQRGFVAVTWQYEGPAHKPGETKMRKQMVRDFIERHTLKATVQYGGYSVLFPG